MQKSTPPRMLDFVTPKLNKYNIYFKNGLFMGWGLSHGN